MLSSLCLSTIISIAACADPSYQEAGASLANRSTSVGDTKSISSKDFNGDVSTNLGLASAAVASFADKDSSLDSSIVVAAKSLLESNAIAPAGIELEDWTSGSPVVVGRTTFSAPQPDLVFQDGDLNAEMGAVKINGVPKPIQWGGFEFGAISFSAKNLAENGADLFQVLVAAKPSGRWASYPFADTFSPSTDLTIPPAFKVRILGSAGQTIGMLQMRDGKPINDPSLSQDRKDPSQALRPFFNCAMLLPWTSGVARPSRQISKLFPGFISYPESRAKLHYSANGSLPMLVPGTNGRQQLNGLNHWHSMAKWPLPSSTVSDPTNDVFGYNVASVWTGDGPTSKSAWITGWGYEPGSISGHDWFTGPGGVRFDRAVIPAPLAYFTSNPSYRRPKDNAPIRDLVEAWGLAYFNHSSHYITDVSNFSTILNSEQERQGASQMNAYYGAGRTFAPASKSIDVRAVTNGSYDLVGSNGGTDPSHFLDSKGRRFWNSAVIDDNHLHQTPYWHSILLNSPMHIVASRAAFNASYLARLGSKEISMRPTNNWTPGSSYASINSRVQAYRWMHYALMWKSATNHSLGVSRESVEKALLDDLRMWHDKLLVPTQNENQNPYHVALKQLGIPVQAWQDSKGQWFLRSEGTALQFYHATLFVTLKSLGLWDVLMKDPKAKATLNFVMECMTKFSVDMILATDGRAEVEDGQVIVAGPFSRFEDINASSVPKSWQDWAGKFPAVGTENWIKDANGKFLERYSGQHLRSQWAFVVRDWFPEFGGQRAVDGAAKYWSFLEQWKANVASKRDPIEQRNADFAFQTLPYWIVKAPQ